MSLAQGWFMQEVMGMGIINPQAVHSGVTACLICGCTNRSDLIFVDIDLKCASDPWKTSAPIPIMDRTLPVCDKCFDLTVEKLKMIKESPIEDLPLYVSNTNPFIQNYVTKTLQQS